MAEKGLLIIYFRCGEKDHSMIERGEKERQKERE
jgi:hypothetical protein